jgi:hypothetical protein
MMEFISVNIHWGNDVGITLKKYSERNTRKCNPLAHNKIKHCQFVVNVLNIFRL